MTRILIMTVIFLFNLLLIKAQEKKSENNQIKVIIKQIPSKNGKIYFALYDKNGFLPKKPLTRTNCVVQNKSAKVVFNSIPNGNYAILCFLDENNNKQLDFDTSSGRPKELYGISNNPTLFGPPQFENAKFEVKNKDVTLNIFLQ